MLALAVAGVAFTNVSAQPLTGYWEFVALVAGIICIITEWKNVEQAGWAKVNVDANAPLGGCSGHDEHRVLCGLRVMLPAPVSTFGPFDVAGATLLFLAGVSLYDPLPICFLGLAMARTVPAIAWLKQSALFLSWLQCS